MDLYMDKILPSYYSDAYKIILICLTICFCISFIGWLLKSKNRILWNISGFTWIIVWLGIIMTFTVFGRTRSDLPRVELRLFWCIKEAWINKYAMNWRDIIGNVFLFLPLGCIVPIYMKSMREMWKVILVGFGTSLTVECIQLLSHLGLFELDDLFHNTLGAYWGYCIYVIIMYVIDKNGQKDRKKTVVVASVSLTAVVVFGVVAIALQQPIFGWM